MSDLTIHVRATAPVLGMWPGEDYHVYPTARVELMIKAGKLIWLDEPEDSDGNEDGPEDPAQAG